MGDQLDPDSGGQKSAENLNLKKENLNLLFTLVFIVKYCKFAEIKQTI